MVRLTGVIQTVSRADWEAVLAQDPAAGPAQTPRWLDCIQAAGPFADATRLYVFDDGRHIGLPMARRRHRPRRWSREASWPFDWSVGGPVSDGPATPAHTTAIAADLAVSPALTRRLHLDDAVHASWAVALGGWSHEVQHVQSVDLTCGIDGVWTDRFTAKTRRDIRKAERAGVTVRADRSGQLIPVFYRLYERSVERWAGQQHEPLALARWRAHRANPERKLRTVAERFGEQCTVWVASHDGTPIAALMVLRHGDHAKYWRGAMDVDRASSLKANAFLHHQAIREACAAGCTTYHMGTSRPGSGLARFKASFGARSQHSHDFRWERLPVTAADARARSAVKKVVRFRDA